jgi:NDP-sugar pyrophosphorylase family protein
MKAMILAAGLGTRLRPLTADRPKALVTVAGRTLLEIALGRLRAFGVREAIVNTHHFAEMVADYLKANANFGMRIEISHEPGLLDTGGGLKQAAPFFLDSSAGPPEPFIVHNVDAISGIDLGRMVQFHAENGALATLAVQRRGTSRALLFDGRGQLCGRWSGPADPDQGLEPLAFCGIHIISPRIFARMSEQGVFSIVDAYVRLAAEGERIVGFRADESYWRDLGRPESVVQAEQDLTSGKWIET